MNKDDKIEWVICGAAILMTLILLWLAASCRTLETIKTEAASIQDELEDAVDSLGAEIVSQIAEKVRREIRRTREKLPRKIRREIERTALKVGLKLRLQKPPTKTERQKTAVYVAEVAKTAKYKQIVHGNTPVLPKLDPLKGEANFVKPVGYKWEPSAKLKKEFFRRNPKMKDARIELQYLMMALWDLGADFVAYETHRSCAKQLEYYKKGVTQIKSCTSNHNKKPSHAVDMVPLEGKKALWEDRQQFVYYAGMARAIYPELARQHGWTARYRYGGDWDKDLKVAEKGTFVDLPHHEITGV